MVGGFAAAGVKYVISCLWTADDFASAVLMAEFYRQYKDRKRHCALQKSICGG